MSSDDHKSHVLMIFNQLTSYVEDILKSYILNEILLVAISILKSSLAYILHIIFIYIEYILKIQQGDVNKLGFSNL